MKVVFPAKQLHRLWYPHLFGSRWVRWFQMKIKNHIQWMQGVSIPILYKIPLFSLSRSFVWKLIWKTGRLRVLLFSLRRIFILKLGWNSGRLWNPFTPIRRSLTLSRSVRSKQLLRKQRRLWISRILFHRLVSTLGRVHKVWRHKLI